MSQTPPLIFDPTLCAQKQARAHATNAPNHLHPLYEEAVKRLRERLCDLKKQPKTTHWAGFGAQTPPFPPSKTADSPGDLADSSLFDGFPPFSPLQTRGDSREGGFKLFVNFLELHHTNDVRGVLHETVAQMASGDLFLAVFPGGNTLSALRESLSEAETALKGRLTPRIAPLISLASANALLQETGLAAPVVDRERITFLYPDIWALMRDLRAMGETNPLTARQRALTPRTLFESAQRHYANHFKESDGFLPATFELIFLHGWKA